MAAPTAMATLFCLWTVGAAFRVRVERGVADEVVVDVERIESGISGGGALGMGCSKDGRWVDELIYSKLPFQYRRAVYSKRGPLKPLRGTNDPTNVGDSCLLWPISR